MYNVYYLDEYGIEISYSFQEEEDALELCQNLIEDEIDYTLQYVS